jgi:hypothetical protein
VETRLVDNRPFAKPRHAIISATPVLREREIAKLAALTDALTEGLATRGVGDLQAVLATHAGMAAFVHSTLAWLENPVPTLGAPLHTARQAMTALLGNESAQSAG